MDNKEQKKDEKLKKKADTLEQAINILSKVNRFLHTPTLNVKYFVDAGVILIIFSFVLFFVQKNKIDLKIFIKEYSYPIEVFLMGIILLTFTLYEKVNEMFHTGVDGLLIAIIRSQSNKEIKLKFLEVVKPITNFLFYFSVLMFDFAYVEYLSGKQVEISFEKDFVWVLFTLSNFLMFLFILRTIRFTLVSLFIKFNQLFKKPEDRLAAVVTIVGVIISVIALFKK